MSNQPERLFHPVMKVIKGIVWQTEGSILLASTDDVVFGKKLAERYLYRTAGGQYFEQYHSSGVKGKLGSAEIHPLSLKDALKCYEKYTQKYLSPAEAFPGAEQA